MANTDFGWAVPIMRAGYAGRGIVYTVIAGFSLYAIWRGGSAEGTSSALAQLENTTWGGVVLFLIFIGMVAYAVWRVIAAIYDLEAEGDDAKGMLARVGMAVTGILHLAIGVLAFLLLFTGKEGGGGGQSKIAEVAGKVMEWPFGATLVGIAGLITVGAGIYYFVKALKEKYRNKLYENDFTRKVNPALKFGVVAQGVIVTLMGAFIAYAGWTANPNEAGGMGKSFSWLSGQVYGQLLVTAVCIGLAGFALFCFVNAGCRIVPKAAGDDVNTLAEKAKDAGREAKRKAQQTAA